MISGAIQHNVPTNFGIGLTGLFLETTTESIEKKPDADEDEDDGEAGLGGCCCNCDATPKSAYKISCVNSLYECTQFWSTRRIYKNIAALNVKMRNLPPM